MLVLKERLKPIDGVREARFERLLRARTRPTAGENDCADRREAIRRSALPLPLSRRFRCQRFTLYADTSPASISTRSWTATISMTRIQSMPAGPYSRITMMTSTRCHECSAEFSSREVSTSGVRRTTDLSLSASMRKAICRCRRAFMRD